MLRLERFIWLLAALILSFPSAIARPDSDMKSGSRAIRNTPMASSATGLTSASFFLPTSLSSTLTTPSDSNGTLKLAQSIIDNITSSECTDPGGGCEVFQLTSAGCQNDTCICDDSLTLAAQVCAQCVATRDIVEAYNTFLESCEAECLSSPNTTIPISWSTSPASQATPVPSVATGLSTSPTVQVHTGTDTRGTSGPTTVTASPFTSLSSGSAASSSSSTVTSGTPAIGNQNLAGQTSSTPVSSSMSSRSSAISTMTSISASMSSSATSVALITQASTIDAGTNGINQMIQSNSPSQTISSSPYPVIASSVTSLHSSVSASFTAPAEATNTVAVVSSLATALAPASTAALSASEIFFSQTIDSSCSTDCAPWQNGSSACADDLCVCTSTIRVSASACSACAGAAGHSAAPSYTQQMSAYSSYTTNCSSISSLTLSGGQSSAILQPVASASQTSTTLPKGMIPSVTSATQTATPAEGHVPVITTVVSGARWKYSSNRRLVALGCFVIFVIG